ncbi:MAG: hypothetical protein ACOYXM_01185 [Actinomycetota bacterium]
MAPTCDLCGAASSSDLAGGEGSSTDLPLGWSSASSSDGMRRLCDRCTRAHVRDIEAKLDEDWWSAPARAE